MKSWTQSQKNFPITIFITCQMNGAKTNVAAKIQALIRYNELYLCSSEKNV